MKTKQQQLSDLSQKTQQVYESNAVRFDNDRNKVLYEKAWLARFQNLLPNGGTILDIGCGTGEPIAQYFIEQGFQVTGIDFSSNMIALAQLRFPLHAWHLMDMRSLKIDEKFDGIIAWHSFFHLNPEEQRKTLLDFINLLNPNGALLLTIGNTEGEVTGEIGDEKVYHASLSCDEYTSLLEVSNMQVIKVMIEDPECSGTSVLLARKISL
ncbi:class I SAM-dependent DNA methyltransferase [Marinicella sp. W31]|uniref:class I SAM-dependent DNA methyltransferase n=1 Tax=Marinicella sp. W31 TaxID=3023713 RepID=UPI003756A341